MHVTVALTLSEHWTLEARTYFMDLLAAIDEQWPGVVADGLDRMMPRGVRAPEPAPLEAPEEVMVSAGHESNPVKDAPRVPIRRADLWRWQRVWRAIKSQVEKRDPPLNICKWLEKMHSEDAVSVETLRDIIAAGEAGLLD